MDMMLAADIVAFSPLSFWRVLGGFPLSFEQESNVRAAAGTPFPAWTTRTMSDWTVRGNT
jgi:hypothetical protein